MTSNPVTTALDLPDRPRAVARARVDAATLLLAGTFLAVWVVSLSRSLFDPIGFDQGLYQYITDRVMLGERMYVDVWDQNAPGIVGIHWLATILVGRSPMALRAFDAGWQLLTLIALIALCVRDGRRWRVGLVAATFYTLAYYAMGYVHTAQRECFAVLPLLLAVHAVTSGGESPSVGRRGRRPLPPLPAVPAFSSGGESTGPWRRFMLHGLAGVMSFAVFAIKPPLGLCFGVLCMVALADGWRQRGRIRWPWAALAGLTTGFVVSTGVGILVLVELGWWAGFWPVLTRSSVPGYVQGPALIRELIPYLLPAAALIGMVAAVIAVRPRVAQRCAAREPQAAGREPQAAGREPQAAGREPRASPMRWPISCALVYVLLLTLQRWPAWQQLMLPFAGLFLPILGAVLVRPWREGSRCWRMQLLLTAACLAAVVLQGQFYRYHLPPLLAFAACLSADELVGGVRRAARGLRQCMPYDASQVWAAVCLAGVIHLAISTWGWTMTFHSASPYVLADATLSEHYTRVTRHKRSFPTYATTALAAERVRALTTATDPIACLIDEPRLYLLAQRPAAFPLLRTQDCYASMFADYIETIRERQPKVVLARVPEQVCGANDPAAVEEAVFDDLAQSFHPSAAELRPLYRAVEVIQEVCILRLVKDGAGGSGADG